MGTKPLENNTGCFLKENMKEVKMSDLNSMLENWSDEVLETEDDVIGMGNESSFIVGYSAVDTKVVMAKLIGFDKSKVKFIELDFKTQDGKSLREKFMILGKDGKPFFMDKKTKKKRQHFGFSKIKALLKVTGLHQDATDPVKAMFTSGEDADVTYTDFGKEKTENFTTFPTLIGAKVKILVTSKKINIQSQFDESDAYLVFCQKNTETFKRENPKRKSLLKFKKTDDYQNTYRWTTTTEVAHFASIDGLLQSEMESGDGTLMDKWLGMNDEGTIFDMRTLNLDDLSEAQRKKYSLNEYGKIVENDSDEEFDEEPEVEEEDSGDSEW